MLVLPVLAEPRKIIERGFDCGFGCGLVRAMVVVVVVVASGGRGPRRLRKRWKDIFSCEGKWGSEKRILCCRFLIWGPSLTHLTLQKRKIQSKHSHISPLTPSPPHPKQPTKPASPAAIHHPQCAKTRKPPAPPARAARKLTARLYIAVYVPVTFLWHRDIDLSTAGLGVGVYLREEGRPRGQVDRTLRGRG